MRGLFPIVLISVLSVCGVANAKSACSSGDDPAIKLHSWNAKKIDDATTEFVLSIETTFQKNVRMVDGYVSYSDVLGERMGAFEFPRDNALPARAKTPLTIKVGSMVVPRILKVNADDVVADLCVKGVVYDDGTQETFK
ncbi:hypothetical protein [Brucella intermedia]|uniref:hypothetical protein n=1 Tax=Brucella intermedia TaxID=94625 RepID=UPI0009897830|nr:hypothetical protein [Brucella intermedia]OOC51222.1 hypothetical protein AS855_01255 [Brucella intermedia M86]